MANNKIFKQVKPSAKLERNGFPLDQRHTYTAKAGMLYPIMTIDTVPNGYYEIDVASLTRTQPLVAPAFVRVKQFHHFFFVPYKALWRNFDNLLTQRYDPTSTTEKVPLYSPTFSLGEIYKSWITAGTLYNTLGVSDKQGARTIMEMLGYGDVAFNTRQDADHPTTYEESKAGWYVNQRVTPWRALAYQKIWYDYYRNHYRDNTVEPRAFNVDDVEANNLANSYMETYRTNMDILQQLFKPQYRGWKKDLFMSSQTSQQFGDISILSSDLNLQLVNRATGAGANQSAGTIVSQQQAKLGLYTSDNTYVNSSVNWSSPGTSLFDVLQLRKAEKLQQWKQQTLLAGNRSLDQYEAHFGVKPFRENLHAQYLGGCDSVVTIDDVTQTTGHDFSGDENTLGQLAGKGTGASNGSKVVKFHSKEFGVLMCIVSFVPELEYDGNNIDKGNTLVEPFDYFTPEFQNLGLEAIPRKSLDAFCSTQVTPDNLNLTLGFAYHYWNYKTAFDKCHTSMSSLGNMRYFNSPRADLRKALETRGGLLVRDFYINPNVLDSVFGYNVDESGNTDQFICVSNFSVKSVLPMSIVGIPQF